MQITWLFFDIGSTLIDETEAYNHRIRDVIADTDITFEEFDRMRIRFARQGLEGNSAAIKHYGLTKTPWHTEDEIPYPNACAVAESLCQKGYRLGIIANQSRGAAERLERWGLRRYFDVIASSAELGYAKPDQRLFELALTLADCAPQQSVMIGDRLDNDMLPAKALGMTTVWIKNGLARYQPDTLGEGIVDHRVESLSDLLNIF